MRILQLIDSLNPGGAEKMAINLANEFANQAEKSFLIATNKGGELKNQISNKVIFKIYNRSVFNVLFVIIGILYFIKKNKITHIQAHSTSYKWAQLIKFIFPKVRFFWHDHNGNRVNLSIEKNRNIIKKSKFFDGVLVCNLELKCWGLKNLKISKVEYFPNFVNSEITSKNTILKGVDGKKIVCIANWRNPKNHLFLVQAFIESKISDFNWSLHLIGKVYNDNYSDEVNNYILNSKNDNIFIYGVKTDTNYILSQANVGVLVSTHEGFPVTLLEYGNLGLCPIISNVGYMPELVTNLDSGFIIDPYNKYDLIKSFKKLETQNIKLLSEKFSKKVRENFDSKLVVNNIKTFFND